MSQTIQENKVSTQVVMDFFDAFSKELFMEYAMELNCLVKMEGSEG